MDNKVHTKRNKLRKNSTLELTFFLKQELLKTKTNSVLLLKTVDDKTFLMVVGEPSKIEEMIKLSSKFSKNRVLLKILRSGSCVNLNPFKLKVTQGSYGYVICEQNKLQLLKDALENRTIDLLQFKTSLKAFLRHYSKLNKDSGLVYNNVNAECLLFRPNIFVMVNFENAIVSQNKSAKHKSLQHKSVQHKSVKHKYNYNKLKSMNANFELKTYQALNDSMNYEIICILWLISISESYLNDVPKGLKLSKEDITFLKSTETLSDKLDYLLKMEYFKFM
tara:strand:+ start:150 stop:983 length:834 start_codon:yes stop_codon:yes gene_type:complete